MKTTMKKTIVTIMAFCLVGAMTLGFGGQALAVQKDRLKASAFSKTVDIEEDRSVGKDSAGTETEDTAEKEAAEVTVSASSSVRLTPDKASVSFGVTTKADTAEQAQNQNSEAVKSVIEALTSRGIEEKSIRTSDYSMYPQYNYDNGTESITGYVVYTTMAVQDQDIKDLEKLFSDCVAAGVNNVNNVIFLCSSYDEAYSQALTQAVQTSREKAEELAKAAGKTLGDVVSITEGWQDTSARYGQNVSLSMEIPAAAEDDAGNGGPTLMTGETEITANVTVTYRLN